MSKSRAQLFQEQTLREMETPAEESRSNNPNPMVRGCGFHDPKGERGETRCKTCRHCLRKRYRSYRGYRCRFRRDTNGPATDHRLKWPACAKYEPKEESQ